MSDCIKMKREAMESDIPVSHFVLDCVGLLVDTAMLCMVAGLSANDVRQEILFATDDVSRMRGISVYHREEASEAIPGVLGNVAARLTLIVKEATPSGR